LNPAQTALLDRTGWWHAVLVLLGALLPLFQSTAAAVAPEDVIQQATAKMQSELRAREDTLASDPAVLRELIDTILVPHFDFRRISRLVLGKYWRRASSEQRQQFRIEFSELLIRSYTNVLVDNADAKIEFLPPRRAASATDAVVKSLVPQFGGPSVSVDYMLALHNDVWKVFDVRIDGISLVSNYRSSFTRQLRQDDLDTLIADLAERNANNRQIQQ